MISNTENRAYIEWAPQIEPISVTINFGIVGGGDVEVYFMDSLFNSYNSLSAGIDYVVVDASTSNFVIYFTSEMVGKYVEPGYICVLRSTPTTQQMRVEDGGILKLLSLEDALDKLTMITQDIYDKLSLTVKVPWEDMLYIEEPSSVYSPQNLKLLPDRNNRKDRYLYFNESGDPEAVKVIDTSVLSITSYAEGFLDCGDSAEARDYLGAPSINGDCGVNFEVASPNIGCDAVNLEYLNAAISSIESSTSENYIDNSRLQVYQSNDIGTPKSNLINDDYVIDRWKVLCGDTNRTTSTDIVYLRSDDVPLISTISNNLFSQSLTTEVPVAKDSSALRWGLEQKILDRRCKDIDGEVVNIGFWVKSQIATPTDKHLYLTVVNNGSSGEYSSYLCPYTILSAHTWEYKTFNVQLPSGIYGETGDASLSIYLCTGGCGGVETSTVGSWVNNTGYPLLVSDDQLFLPNESDLNIKFSNVCMVKGQNVLPTDGSMLPDELLSDEYFKAQQWMYAIGNPTRLFSPGGSAAQGIIFFMSVEFPIRMIASPILPHYFFSSSWGNETQVKFIQTGYSDIGTWKLRVYNGGFYNDNGLTLGANGVCFPVCAYDEVNCSASYDIYSMTSGEILCAVAHF